MTAADLRQRNHSTGFAPAFLNRLYAIPNPFKTIEDYFRHRHDDLADLSGDDLRAELRCVRRRLDYDGDVVARFWLTTRQDAVLAELRRRKSRAA